MTLLSTVNPHFITLEGGEGAGKSTQIKLLAEWLNSHSVTCICTREPGGSPGAEQIRDLLVKGAIDRWATMTEALLMAASRSEHVERTIKPALKAGKWVLCDRFADSSIAYQGAGRGLGVDHITNLQHLVLKGFSPDLTIILDLPVKTGLARAKARETTAVTGEDRFERMDIEFHEKLRAAYHEIAQKEPKRCILINATGSIEQIQNEIRTALSARLKAS